jgi:hypothetical protein
MRPLGMKVRRKALACGLRSRSAEPCEAEVYRFTWNSSFDGDAVVRIGRHGDEITLR